jgi:hypothetical protein
MQAEGTSTRHSCKITGIFIYLDTAGSRPVEHEAGGYERQTEVLGIRTNIYFSVFGYSWQ